MLLAPESHRRIEGFLREYLRDEGLELPRVHIHAGPFARWATGRLHVLAITVGRRILVAPKAVVKDEAGRPNVSGSLIVHEATHVVQYGRAGFLGFLFSYMAEFWRALREQPGWGKAARQAAYLAIRQEREAYEAEAAYRAWLVAESLSGTSKDEPLA